MNVDNNNDFQFILLHVVKIVYGGNKAGNALGYKFTTK